MKLIASSLARQAGQVCVFVASTSDWNVFGESAWREMVQTLDRQPAARRVMGVDTEWFKKNPLAVFQIATSSHCFVIHLSYLDNRALPLLVKDVLADATVIKCGVGIHEDVKRLRREQQVEVRTVMNVENYAILLGEAVVGQTNLAALTQHVCGMEMVDKHKRITMSNWELPLSEEQQRYAADDAMASYLVGATLLSKAVTLRNSTEETFDAEQWLKMTQATAQQCFKAAQKAKQQAARDALKGQADVAAAEGDGAGAGEAGDGVMKPFWNEGSKIRVLSKEGKYLFDCSTSRAKFYVKEKGIAEITKYRPNSTHKAEEIRLLFDPQVKSRICLYDAVGLCELGRDCPYAHGVGELTEEARQLLTSRQPSCAWCLSATNLLMKRAIVPPSFRKHLHPPLCYPSPADFVPLCQSCNSVVMRYIDEEMKRCYREAEEIMKAKNESIPLKEIGKTISYARLLKDEAKTAKIPDARLNDLKDYIWQHWELTHMREMEHHFSAMGRVPRAQDDTADDDVDGDDNEAREDRDAEVGADDEAGSHDEEHEVEEDGANREETQMNTAPLTYPTSVEGVDGPFLRRLSALVPGDIRAHLTVEALLHQGTPEEQAEKEQAFVARWRTYLVDACKMVEKDSNVLSNAEWQELRKANKSYSNTASQ